MKKSLSVIINPVIVVILFCCIIISGESNGGLYIWYILLGLPHAAIHSLLGAAGIVLVMFGNFPKNPFKKSAFNIAGGLLMAMSLGYFFMQQGGSYNWQTFHLPLPLLIVVIFAVIIVGFIMKNTHRINLKI